MKILYVLNDTLHHAGTESVILNYYNHIDRDTIHIDFLLNAPKSELKENDICRYLLQQGSNVFCITPRRENAKANKEEFLKVLKDEEYDIVHTHIDAIGSYFLNLAKEAGVKVRIAHAHNTRHQLKIKGIKSRIHYAYLEKCRKDIRKVATHYMACSKEAGEWLFGEDAVSEDKVYLLNNAIDVDNYRKNLSVRGILRQELGLENELVIGHVGRFKPQKNHDYLLDVFAKVCEKREDVRLLLIGDGPLKGGIEQKAEDLGIKDKVIFMGEVDNVGKYLNAMDVFAFPSLYEGLSVVMVEAQANGLRCIMADSERVSKDTILTGNVVCIKTDDKHKDKWAEALLDFGKEHADTAQEIKDKGYDITLEAKRLERYYKGLLKD